MWPRRGVIADAPVAEVDDRRSVLPVRFRALQRGLIRAGSAGLVLLDRQSRVTAVVRSPGSVVRVVVPGDAVAVVRVVVGHDDVGGRASGQLAAPRRQPRRPGRIGEALDRDAPPNGPQRARRYRASSAVLATASRSAPTRHRPPAADSRTARARRCARWRLGPGADSRRGRQHGGKRDGRRMTEETAARGLSRDSRSRRAMESFGSCRRSRAASCPGTRWSLARRCTRHRAGLACSRSARRARWRRSDGCPFRARRGWRRGVPPRARALRPAAARSRSPGTSGSTYIRFNSAVAGSMSRTAPQPTAALVLIGDEECAASWSDVGRIEAEVGGAGLGIGAAQLQVERGDQARLRVTAGRRVHSDCRGCGTASSSSTACASVVRVDPTPCRLGLRLPFGMPRAKARPGGRTDMANKHDDVVEESSDQESGRLEDRRRADDRRRSVRTWRPWRHRLGRKRTLAT